MDHSRSENNPTDQWEFIKCKSDYFWSRTFPVMGIFNTAVYLHFSKNVGKIPNYTRAAILPYIMLTTLGVQIIGDVNMAPTCLKKLEEAQELKALLSEGEVSKNPS